MQKQCKLTCCGDQMSSRRGWDWASEFPAAGASAGQRWPMQPAAVVPASGCVGEWAEHSSDDTLPSPAEEKKKYIVTYACICEH